MNGPLGPICFTPGEFMAVAGAAAIVVLVVVGLVAAACFVIGRLK